MLKKCKIEKKANPKVEQIYTNPYTVSLYIRGNSKKLEKKLYVKMRTKTNQQVKQKIETKI